MLLQSYINLNQTKFELFESISIRFDIFKNFINFAISVHMQLQV